MNPPPISDKPSTESSSAESAGKTSIVLVEDHAILRIGLRSMLIAQPDFSVVGEAGTCSEGLEVVRATRPNVVITDVDLPDRTGLTLIPDLKAFDNSIKVIVLTSQCTSDLVREALSAGASGYVLKGALPSELMQGIRTVMQGKKFLSAGVISSISL
ncbi:MAG: response regulator transcription factor [Woeseiaceae bacterium]|nr:response regulator transcription factor [Woeseiaceae bacterium]